MSTSKTYKKGSRHNLYNENLATFNLRVSQELRRKIEIAAKENGLGLADFARMLLTEAVKDVVLTSADYQRIDERVRINEERNAKRIAE